MTEVNLLPADLRRRQRTRQLTSAAAGLAALVVLLLLLVFLYESGRLSTANNHLDEQNATNAQLQSQITDLQRFDQLKGDVDQRQALVDGLLQEQVMWSGVLHDVSMVIPGQVYLTQVSGLITESPGSTDTLATPAGILGAIQFQGVALDHPDVALWLTRLEQVDGWENPWVTVSQKTTSTVTSGATTGTTVNFTGSVDLTADATANGRAP
jgi:Tfp pilus assembly protein PilN